jgi:hypothetical protein
MLRRLLSALGVDLFGRAKLMLAFEYGLQVAEVARAQGLELTPELVEKAEAMLLGEARTQSATHMAVNAVPNLLSAFEIDVTK